MGMMVNGVWSTQWYAPDEKGRFVRNPTVFRGRVEAPVAGRYHLYVSYACPWAHRTLIMRKLKGLEDAVSLSVVNPFMGQDGWSFEPYPGATADTVNHAHFLREVYARANPDYTGRVTVPVLWDRHTGTIVNNESREIMRMLDVDFEPLAARKQSYAPEASRDEIDRVIDALYEPVNNGVYRAGFAESQEAYDEAIADLFSALDHWDAVLSAQRYLVGNDVTEADWCLFTTLYRFDPVYFVHFKCSLRRIADYPHLKRYMRDLYAIPGVAETCNLDHIKRHYFTSHRHLNPTGIIPPGPDPVC